MSYSFAQIETIWIQNGGNSVEAPIAAAVAMAESGGDPNATNHNSNGSTDKGLWQINSIWGALSTYDVTANAKAAIHISNNGANWSPWVTYTTGAYRKFLSSVSPAALTAASAGVTGQGTPSSGGGIGDVAAWLTNIPTTFGDFFRIFHNLISPSFWLRIGAFFVGMALLGVGIYALIKADSDKPKGPGIASKAATAAAVMPK